MAVTVELKNMDVQPYLIYLFESRLHSLSLACGIFTSTAESIWVRSSWDDHRRIGVPLLHALVVHDVLRIILPIFKQVMI